MFHTPDHHPQTSVVTFDNLQVAPGSTTGVHMKKQHGVIEHWTGLNSLSMTCQIWATGKQQTSVDDRSGWHIHTIYQHIS